MAARGLKSGNLFAAVPDSADQEQALELFAGPGVRIERIVSTGQASPEGFWYDQEQDEWVVVLRGSASLEVEGEEDGIDMGPGDWIYLPAHRRHRVAATGTSEPTIWLAVHATSA